jgi:hypothetical protein
VKEREAGYGGEVGDVEGEYGIAGVSQGDGGEARVMHPFACNPKKENEMVINGRRR